MSGSRPPATARHPLAHAPQAPTALAPQHLRLFALIVDTLLAVVLLNLADKLLLGAQWDLRPPLGTRWQAAWLLGAAILLLRDLPARGSLGKWFMGIALGRAAHPARPPALRARLLRNVALVLLPVEALLVFMDPYCRRLGDRLAGTVVVARARPAPVTRRLLGMAIFFLATLLAIFLVELWNVHRSAAYPTALALARTHPEVQATFGADVAFSAPGLTRSTDGRRMHVQLSATGGPGEGRVYLELRLVEGPLHWELERLEVAPPPQAKSAPHGTAAQPKVEDAPAR